MTEQQRKAELHQQYVAYIKELRRLKAEKYGEQLTFDFMKEADDEPQKIDEHSTVSAA